MMTDLRDRFALVDRVEPPPDLWGRALHKTVSVDHTTGSLPSSTTVGRRLLAAGVALLVFAGAGVLTWAAFRDRPGAPNIPQPASTVLPKGWTDLGRVPGVPTPTTVWTGSELISWGGGGEDGPGPLRSDGFRFDPLTGEVASIPDAPLEPRSDPAATWTGQEMLIWGGWREAPPFFDDGAAYDPATNTWRKLPPAPISARVPLSAWTGSEWILWGTSVRRDDRPTDGAAYDPATNTWHRIADGPVQLTDASAMWTGTEFVVVGAALHGGNYAETPTAIAAAYDPDTDSWRKLPASPLDPNSNTAVWADDRVVGVDQGHVTAMYDPSTDEWSRMGRLPGDECEGGLAAAQATKGWVVVADCGTIAMLPPGADQWKVPTAGPETFYPRTVAGGDSILVLAPQGETDEVELWSFRPPRPDEGDGTTSTATRGSGVLSIACTRDGAMVDASVVTAERYGVRLDASKPAGAAALEFHAVDSSTGTAFGANAEGGGTLPALSPGRWVVGCLESDRESYRDVPTAVFEVIDPEGFWVQPGLDCDNPTVEEVGVLAGIRELRSPDDLRQAAEAELTGILATDVFQGAGYGGVNYKLFRYWGILVRDGQRIADVKLLDDGSITTESCVPEVSWVGP